VFPDGSDQNNLRYIYTLLYKAKNKIYLSIAEYYVLTILIYQSNAFLFDSLFTNMLTYYLNPSPKFFSSFPHGTSTLKVSHQ